MILIVNDPVIRGGGGGGLHPHVANTPQLTERVVSKCIGFACL